MKITTVVQETSGLAIVRFNPKELLNDLGISDHYHPEKCVRGLW